MDSGLTSLVTAFSPAPIYEASASMAQYVASLITPIMLVLAIYVRIGETQLANLSGNSRWALAVKDLLLWGSVLALYFAIANEVGALFNAFYEGLARQGSTAQIFAAFDTLVARVEAQQATQESGVWSAMTDMGQSLVNAVGFGVYYLSWILVVFIGVFMHLAHAIGYGIAFILGLLVIPTAMTQSVRLLRGWAVLLGAILLWPLIESIALGLYGKVFSQLAATWVHEPAESMPMLRVYILYTVLNLIIAVIAVGSPLLAGAIAGNGNALAQWAMPFVVGAVGASGAYRRAVTRAVPAAGRHGWTLTRASGQALTRVAHTVRTSSSRGPAPQSGSARQAAGSTASPTASTPTTPRNEDAARRARQTRRGVMIQKQRQKHKPQDKTP